MKVFKTPKGTDLPISDIKGKDYLTVAYRLVWFREEHPSWTVKTEMVHSSEQSCLFRAEILTDNGTLVASSHKREHKAHFADFEEKAETGAIGRALAACGYGTQFAPDIHEDDRIVDSPQEPKKPVAVVKTEKPKTTSVKGKDSIKECADHTWRPSKFPDKLTGQEMDYCVVCKKQKFRAEPAFDPNEELPF